jgi:hypothetical protein
MYGHYEKGENVCNIGKKTFLLIKTLPDFVFLLFAFCFLLFAFDP